MVQPEDAVAVAADLMEGVGDEHEGLPARDEALHALVALALELLVADREGLVHEQDVGVDVGGDRERQPRGHPGREGPDGRVDELLQLRPGDDAVEAPPGLGPREAEEGALEHDVLASRQLAVEAEPELEDGRDSAGDVDAALRGRQDAGDDAEERALARAVSPDQSDALAGHDREVDRVQGLEVVVSDLPLQPADRVFLERADALPRNAVAQRHLLEADRGRHRAVSSSTPCRRGDGRNRPSR